MKKTQRVFLLFSAIYFGFILSLGLWWLHLIVKYGEQVDALGGSINGPSVAKMVKWEGATFFTVLILLSISFVMLYIKDQRKTKGLQAFFASMTHELKTPLASIRLQAEVLHENIEDSQNKMLTNFSSRLIEDTNKMETQMDKILQLSRLEGGGDLILKEVELTGQITQAISRWASLQEVNLEDSQEARIMADPFALELILRNLFENTNVHAKDTPIKMAVSSPKDSSLVRLTYQDQGSFSGELKKLTNIFYRHNSHKGSGIGLYLIHRLMKKMEGKLEISLSPESSLCFTLFFPKART